MTENAMPAPLAAVESFTDPASAQTEYRRYMASPEFQAAQSNVGAKGPAMARLEALAKAAWPTPGQGASPASQNPQAVRAAQNAIHDAQAQRSAADAGQGEPLSEADEQRIADAFAPREPADFKNAIPDAAHPYAADLRQMFFDDRISPSVANLVFHAPQMIERASAMDDESYFGALDKAVADTKALPGGRAIIRKALSMVDALPNGHPYIPIAEALLLKPGGILEIAHWSDRLRGKARA